MVILHIAAIENNPFNGVCVAAPQHVISQKEYADVGFINIKNIEIEELKQYPGTQMSFVKPFDIKKLSKPFDNPDIVVFHECYRPDYLRIAKNLRKNKIPYVDMPHGELRVEAQKKKHFKKVMANLLLFNDFTNHAVAIQCLSNAEIEATHFGRKKFIGSNGISMPLTRKKEFSNVGVKFIYIGRYEWRVKGLDLLFEAIHKNAEYLRQNQCSFILYGPDILGRLEQVKQLVKENQIEDLVTLNLEISGKEKERALLNADIFVQTSRHEGMPMGILEAMSYGLPCLVTRGTSIGEEIDYYKSGWMAEPNANSIKEILLKAVKEKQSFPDYSNNAISFIKNNYSWEKVSKQTIEMYESLVSP